MDIRDILFKNIMKNEYVAEVIVERSGIISGIEKVKNEFEFIKDKITFYKDDGDTIKKLDCICSMKTNPKEIAILEEKIMGMLSKYSGIATAANTAVKKADNRAEIVSGSWKKMPPEIKDNIREAILAGGATFRISKKPMLYIDKNYISMFGSITNVLKAAEVFEELEKIIQIRGINFKIEEEVDQAIENGCRFLMVDTGNLSDLERCNTRLEEKNMRDKVKVAYAGNVKIDSIDHIIEQYKPDTLCIGKEIVDAPILDMKLNVIREENKESI